MTLLSALSARGAELEILKEMTTSQLYLTDTLDLVLIWLVIMTLVSALSVEGTELEILKEMMTPQLYLTDTLDLVLIWLVIMTFVSVIWIEVERKIRVNPVARPLDF
jgi:hypothetical protein